MYCMGEKVFGIKKLVFNILYNGEETAEIKSNSPVHNDFNKSELLLE